MTFSSLKTKTILEAFTFLSKVLIDRYCLCIDDINYQTVSAFSNTSFLFSVDF